MVNKPLFHTIIAEIPVTMERGGKVSKEKSYAMRLARSGRRFDNPGELRGKLGQLQLLFAQQLEVIRRRPEPIGPGLAQRRADPGMRILKIDTRSAPLSFEHL